MKPGIDLSDWVLDKKTSNAKRTVNLSVHLAYPAIKTLLKLTPAVRKTKIETILKTNFNKLIDTTLFDTYTHIGTKKKPRGLTATVAFAELSKISKLPFINTIMIHKISQAKKVKPVLSESAFYCVKMT